MKNQTGKKFRLFDMNRDGKGVEKGEDTTLSFKFYFKQIKRKFTKIITANLMMVFQVIPLIVCALIYLSGPQVTSVYHASLPVLNGISVIGETSEAGTLSLLLGQNIGLGKMPTYNTPVYWIIGAILLVYVVTYGWQKVGSIYIMRGLVRGDGVFIWSDFFYAVKKNWKQGLILGILDILCLIVLFADLIFFYNRVEAYGMLLAFFGILLVCLTYLTMRHYLYLMLVTFDIKLRKLFKNAFIFAILGFKRNILARLAIVLVAVINFALMLLFNSMNIVVFMILPLFYFLGFAAFTYTYASYPVIEKYMIAPYRQPRGSDSPDEENVDPS